MAQAHRIKRRLYFALSLNVPFIVFTLSLFASSLYLQSGHQSPEIQVEIKGNYTETMNFLHYPIYAVSGILWTESGVTAKIDLESDGLGLCSGNLPHLLFEAWFFDENTLRIALRNAVAERWEPDLIPPQRKYWFNNYLLEIEEYPFAFTVTRRGDARALFDSRGKNSSPVLCYTDKYIEFSTRTVPSPYIYGLGERSASFPLRTDNRNYTIWPNGRNPSDVPGEESPGLYGHHPFYMELIHEKAHGVFFHNFNAMEVDFSVEKMTFRTTGGVIDLFVFLGTEPETVLQQYQAVIGRPVLPPYWALGYHQGRSGYTNLNALKTVVQKHRNYGIPLDALWIDTDYMRSERNFEVDSDLFPLEELKNFTTDLKAAGVHIMVVIKSGIAVSSDVPFNQGMDSNVFLKDSNTNDVLTLHSPAGDLAFVDFFHPNASSYWTAMLTSLQSQLDFDGLWLVGNEVTVDQDASLGFNSVSLPFQPGNMSLEHNTLPLNTKHYGGDLCTEYNAHSLYGSMQTEATRQFFQMGKEVRPIVASRSTKAGDGKQAIHFLGDNYSTWDNLRASIPGMLNFQLFGLPLTGSNVCGYLHSASEELCTRWMQLGTFSPLFLNRNSQNAVGQEVYQWNRPAQGRMKQAITLRYSLVSYLYSLLFSAALKGGSVIRPLFFEFPKEDWALKDTEHFMIGSALYFSPVVYEEMHEAVMTLPVNSMWYNYFTGERIQGRDSVRMYTGLDSVALFIRAGQIVTYQNATGVVRIETMLTRPLAALIALDDQKQAKGDLYLDDGAAPDTINRKRFSHISFRAFKEEFSVIIEIRPIFQGYIPPVHLIGLKLYGLHLRSVDEVTITTAQLSELIHVHTFVYSESMSTLEIVCDLDLQYLNRIRVS